MAALTGNEIVICSVPTEALPDGLAEALDTARSPQRRHRKREDLAHCLWHKHSKLNQKSVVTIVGIPVETNMSNCPKHASLLGV